MVEQNESRDTKITLILAQIGRIALDNDYLNAKLQQNSLAVNKLKKQLVSLKQEEKFSARDIIFSCGYSVKLSGINFCSAIKTPLR